MFRSLTGAVTATALVTTGLVAGTSEAASGEPVLTVPSRPAGDVTVTAAADADAYPYLQVKVTRRGMVTEPYPAMTAIPTPPVQNTGSPVDVVVPTWGIDGSYATYVLLGCSSSDPGTCTDLLATEDHFVQQEGSLGVDFSGERSGPLLVPIEELHVFPWGSAGGRVEAIVDGERLDIEYGTTTDLTPYLDDPRPDGLNFGSTEIKVRRCSAVTRDETFCEDVAGQTTVDFLRRIAPTNTTTPSRAFTMGPSWSSSSQTWKVETETLGADYSLTWELRDPDTDAVLVEPQDASPTSSSVERDAVIKPADYADELPDGTYDVVLTAAVDRGTGHRLAGTTRTSIEVLNDPPSDGLQVRDADRIVRNLGYGELRTAHFVVDAVDYSGRAELVMREDRTGVDVLHQDVGTADFCGECANRKGYDFELHPYGDDNHLLLPRTYTARLRMHDSWDRPIEVPLGKIYFQDTRTRRVRTVVRPAKVRVRGTRHVGRCSTLRTPDPAGVRGALWFRSLSRCGSRRGDDDLARQVLRVRVPKPVGEVHHISNISVHYRAWGRGPGAARAACKLRETSWRGDRVERKLRWRQLCGSGFVDSWEDAGKFARLRLRAVRGERLDLRLVRVVVVYQAWYSPR